MTTIDVAVAAGADDGAEIATNTTHNGANSGQLDATGEYFFHRHNVNGLIANGDTVDVGYFTYEFPTNTLDEPQGTLWLEDSATPAAVTAGAGNSNISSRAPTTATVAYDEADLGAPGDFNTPSMVGPMQEVVDSYGDTITYIAGIYSAGATATRDFTVTAYDGSTTLCPRLHMETTAAGGTEFTEDVAGTLTSAGTLANRTGKPLTGAVTSAGALLLRTGKVLSGSVGSAGALVLSARKVLSGVVASAGALANRTGKALAGALTSSGVVSTIKLALVLLAGTLTSSGNVARAITKSVAGALTTTGDVLKRLARSFAGTLSTAGTVLAELVAPVGFSPPGTRIRRRASGRGEYLSDAPGRQRAKGRGDFEAEG